MKKRVNPVSIFFRGYLKHGLWSSLSRLLQQARKPAPRLFRQFLITLLITGCNQLPETEGNKIVATPSSPITGPTTLPEPTTLADSMPSEASVRPKRTITPEQLTGYVPNPYMGWQDTQRSHKRFTERVGYKRINWNVLNPAEEAYDWSVIEAFRADMVRQGSLMSFRIRTAHPPPWGEGEALPAWLKEQGAAITEGHSEVDQLRSSEPLYTDCLFLEAHGRFIEALRERYDGDSDLAYLDIGSYGAYGEWDSEQYDEEPDSLDWHARRRIIDMYLGGRGTRPCLEADGQIAQATYTYKGFQQTQLIMPYTPWFADSLVYALTRRSDVGIRHDALGSEKHQQRYREEIGNWVAQRWPHAPIVFEFMTTAYKPDTLRLAQEFAQEMHASFIHENFTGLGDDTLIEEVLVRVGYRLVLQEISYTAELAPGETLLIDMRWQNSGVAPPYYKTYPLVISLTGAGGESRLEQQLQPDIREWLPGQSFPLQTQLPLPSDFPTGKYDLRLAFVDPVTQQPALALAIVGRDEQGRYLIGQVNVLSSSRVTE